MCSSDPPHLPATEPTRVTALLRATTEPTVLGQTDSSGARQLCIPVSNRAGKREGSGQAPGEVGMLSYLMPLAVRIPHVSQMTSTEPRNWSHFRSACLPLHFNRGPRFSELRSSASCPLYELFRSKREAYLLMGFHGAKMLTGIGGLRAVTPGHIHGIPITYRRATLDLVSSWLSYVKFKTTHPQAQSTLRRCTCDHILRVVLFPPPVASSFWPYIVQP